MACGASRHMTSIASWSPRKSEPLTVSKGCDAQLSSGFRAAFMPPWAAFECERTGWTLDRSATDTPSSAAARAARWPASPAPITRTSCVGKARGSLRRVRPQRPSHLVRGDDPAQHPVAVDGEQATELSQALGGQERVERRVLRDLERAGVGDHHLVGRVLVAERFGHLVDLALRE